MDSKACRGQLRAHFGAMDCTLHSSFESAAYHRYLSRAVHDSARLRMRIAVECERRLSAHIIGLTACP